MPGWAANRLVGEKQGDRLLETPHRLDEVFAPRGRTHGLEDRDASPGEVGGDASTDAEDPGRREDRSARQLPPALGVVDAMAR